MGKKKDKPQIVNNIQELNLEIDYEKLAEAIVRAQEKNAEVENKNHRYTTETFATLVMIMFRILSIVGWVVSVITFIAVPHVCPTLQWSGIPNIAVNILGIALIELVVVALFIYSIVLWRSAKEIEKEKDRNYIISVFSGVVSFVALIVALIALFKGVG